jgi:hypothetical protein
MHRLRGVSARRTPPGSRVRLRYNRWWYARIPWLYSLPIMRKRLSEDWQARAARPYGLLFVAVGLLIAGRAVIAVSAM